MRALAFTASAVCCFVGWAMQIKSIAADIEDPDQLINQLRDDLMKHTDEKMESMMAAMMKKFERLEGLIKRPKAGTVYE